MGVPGFFVWLLRKYSNSKPFITNTIDKQIDYLLFDANCLIHPICSKILNDNIDDDINTVEDKMIDAIISYLNELIIFVNPNKGVYIAIDGVPPMAKIKQQRMRRLKSLIDKKTFDTLKIKYNKPISQWNNSAITPGTKFMDKLHNNILNYINTCKYNIIYSSCYTPAEGEHKLLEFIKLNINYSYVMYGLDADLIFLSLSTMCTNIFLLRESHEINKDDTSKLLYVNIEIMKDCIYNTITTTILNDFKHLEEYILDRTSIIKDFIFVCFFLGNDFLPILYSIDIYNNGIAYLIKEYTNTINEMILNNDVEYIYAIKENNINIDFIQIFIKRLAYNEHTLLCEHYNNTKYTHILYKRLSNIIDPYEKEYYKLDNLLFNIIDPIKIGVGQYEDYRNRFYIHYWHLNENELEDFVSEMIKQYILGLRWISLYYFDKIPSWDWFYPFEFPPFINDINKYLIKHKDTFLYAFIPSQPITIFEQQLIIFPQQANYLLPKSLRRITTDINSSLAYMYPTNITQSFINKKKYWMGIPLLPQIDLELIKHIYKKYKNELLNNEIHRNDYKDIFTNIKNI